jgi:hypothetical protein
MRTTCQSFSVGKKRAEKMAKDLSKEIPTAEELRAQQLAYELSDAIKAKDGTTKNEKGEIEKRYDEVEYVAVIYRDGDTLRASRLHTINEPSKAPLGLAIKEAGGAENVVGVVHNHPDAHVASQQGNALAANRLPSSGDWDVAESVFGKRKDVTYFVLDPDDKLRAYDYEDRRKWLTHLEGPKVGPNKGNPDYKSAPELERPMLAPAQGPEPKPDQASRQSQELYAQATSKQLPAMQQFSTDDQQRMCAHAVYLGSARGWTGIEGIAPNNATAQHRAGEFLCVAGKSNSPDPAVNGVAVPMSEALKASPAEWLTKADTTRQEHALTQEQAQTQGQERSQAQVLSIKLY